MRIDGFVLLVSLSIASACGKTAPASAQPPGAALELRYEGVAFDAPSMLFLVLKAEDGTKHPLQLSPEKYSAFQDCSRCPADRPIQQHSPFPGGPPPRRYEPGMIARYVTLSKDVLATCPAGGSCIRQEPIPPGRYEVELGHRLRCPGIVTVPLVGETVLRCTRDG